MRDLTSYLADAAAERPQARAVEFFDASLTYAELHAQSTALAQTLLLSGISQGDRVGLWLRKSLESIIGIYGILKAGAAYVPIDPSAPYGRAAKIVADCQLAGVIADEDQVGWLLQLPSTVLPAQVIISVERGSKEAGDPRVTSWHEAVRGAPALTPASAAAADRPARNTAYVLYTSGSKGTPKGVALSHANAMAFVEWAVGEFAITASDRVSSHAPLHFDLSVLDIFATCLAGACVVLLPESQVGLGGVLIRVVIERKVTVWYSVPNALSRMVTAGNSGLLGGSRLRVVLFAGENFPLGPLRRLRELIPEAALYNLYGPTETNVCTFHRVLDSDLAQGRTESVPIGRPCPYALTFVVDDDGVPLDRSSKSTGELCVSGASVMVGYWGDAQLTAEKTLLIEQEGTLVPAYRTGDMVRIGADGRYVFLGRIDDLVKIRGHRVELGEVESVISEAEQVGEVVCVAAADASGEKHIEAYVVPLSSTWDEAELRQHCLRTLPRYMVPERFHRRAVLARTQSGKLDRRSLLNHDNEGLSDNAR